MGVMMSLVRAIVKSVPCKKNVRMTAVLKSVGGLTFAMQALVIELYAMVGRLVWGVV